MVIAMLQYMCIRAVAVLSWYEVNRNDKLKNIAAFWPLAGKIIIQQVCYTKTKTYRHSIPPPRIKIDLTTHASLVPGDCFIPRIHFRKIIKEIAPHP